MVTRNLTGQQRLYDIGPVTQNKGYYHSLSIIPEVGCIAGFVLNC
jgi:C4-dicarboxylate-specific signal transduction histidine kinase